MALRAWITGRCERRLIKYSAPLVIGLAGRNRVKGCLEIGILGGGIEAGTGLEGIEVVMTEDDGTGETLLELSEKAEKGLALLWGAGVGGLTVDIEATFVADADGVAIVTPTVGSGLLKRTAGMTGAVATDVVVIADVAESSTEVVGAHLLGTVGLHGKCCSTVDDDESYGTHVL